MLITFEGIDGSGKTTQAKILYDLLKSQSHDVILTKEPGGGGGFSMGIRQLLFDYNVDLLTEALALSATRSEHIVNIIKPALMNGSIVISDRFIDTSIVYFMHPNKEHDKYSKLKALIHEMQTILCDNIEADITFLLDTPFQNISDRMKTRTEINRYDIFDVTKYNRVMSEYFALKEENDKICVIDGTGSIQDVSKRIIRVLCSKFDNFKPLESYST